MTVTPRVSRVAATAFLIFAATLVTYVVAWILWGDDKVVYLEPEEVPEPYYAEDVVIRNQAGPDGIPLVEAGGTLFITNSRCNTYDYEVRVTTQADTIRVEETGEHVSDPALFTMFPPVIIDPGGSACPGPDREPVPSAWQIDPRTEPGLYFARVYLTVWGPDGAVRHTTEIITDLYQVIDPEDCPVGELETIERAEGSCTAPLIGSTK